MNRQVDMQAAGVRGNEQAGRQAGVRGNEQAGRQAGSRGQRE